MHENKRKTEREQHKLKHKPRLNKVSKDNRVSIQVKVKDTNKMVVAHHYHLLDTRQPRVQPKVNTANREVWSTHKMVATCTTNKVIPTHHMVNKPINSVSNRHTPTLSTRSDTVTENQQSHY